MAEQFTPSLEHGMRLMATRFRGRERPLGWPTPERLRADEAVLELVRCEVERAGLGCSPAALRRELMLRTSAAVGSSDSPEWIAAVHKVRSLFSGREGAVWPAGGKSKVQVNGLWGTRCGWCLPLCGVGCAACQVSADALERLTVGMRADLQALHAAAEAGDQAALMATWDWHSEHLGLAPPGLGAALGLPEAGLWWPGIEWEGDEG